MRKSVSTQGENADLWTKVLARKCCMNLIKPATMLAPYKVAMHVKWFFSDWIQYGCQACEKGCLQ